MIDINLFPQKYRKRIGTIYNPRYAPIAFTVAVLLCLTAYNVTNLEGELINDRQNQLTKKNNAISTQVATINQNKQEIEQIRQSFITASEKWSSNTAISKYMQAIGESTESDLWIDKLTYSNQQIQEQSTADATSTTADNSQNTAISDSTKVYYVDGSKTYHLKKDCPELTKSKKTIQEKTYKEVKALGITDACDICAKQNSSATGTNNTSTTNKTGSTQNNSNNNTTVNVQPISPTVSTGNYFIIHGYSFSYKGISQLIKNIKQDGLPYAEITKLSQKEYENKVGYIEFEISCSTTALTQNNTTNATGTDVTTQNSANNSSVQTSNKTNSNSIKTSSTNTSTTNK